jgi:hypothetical protein
MLQGLLLSPFSVVWRRISVVTESMVSVGSAANSTLQCYDTIYGGNGKRQRTPERNDIGHTHGNTLSGAKA